MSEQLDVRNYEKAARTYCQLLGEDPDENAAHGADPGPSGITPDILLYSPRWMRRAREIMRHDLLDKALRQAKGETE